ncbi:MAG: OmpA family protein, partial [Deltaproteobacteria bacterium]|nr:OmpA family protein [Deltaproteobacteria bacterium]
EYNMRLSQSRAEHVMEALVERGMPASMLVAQGFGDTRLLTRGDSEGSMQRNRRVEFVVLSRRRIPAGQGAAPELTAPEGESGDSTADGDGPDTATADGETEATDSDEETGQ